MDGPEEPIRGEWFLVAGLVIFGAIAVALAVAVIHLVRIWIAAG